MTVNFQSLPSTYPLGALCLDVETVRTDRKQRASESSERLFQGDLNLEKRAP